MTSLYPATSIVAPLSLCTGTVRTKLPSCFSPGPNPAVSNPLSPQSLFLIYCRMQFRIASEELNQTGPATRWRCCRRGGGTNKPRLFRWRKMRYCFGVARLLALARVTVAFCAHRASQTTRTKREETFRSRNVWSHARQSVWRSSQRTGKRVHFDLLVSISTKTTFSWFLALIRFQVWG